jgi:hypothetical protein
MHELINAHISHTRPLDYKDTHIAVSWYLCAVERRKKTHIKKKSWGLDQTKGEGVIWGGYLSVALGVVYALCGGALETLSKKR